MNKCIITGRIAHDLELRATTTGKSICDFRIATNRPILRDGERVTDFINCRVWNKIAENLVKYQTKGNMIAVIGRIQVDVYQDSEGKNKYNTYILVEELEFLETKKVNANEHNETQEDNEFKDFKINTEVEQQFDYMDEDLPF